MHVGVPKEIKDAEARVGLTPAGARDLVAHGHRVSVENDAGRAAGFADAVYVEQGAEILGTADAVFETADMIVKVKEPQPAEYKRLRENQILFAYLHLAPDPKQARGLIDAGCTAIAYETVTGANGGLPLLSPMSEVAGRPAVGAGRSEHAGERGRRRRRAARARRRPGRAGRAGGRDRRRRGGR
ncbi:MAG TPA: hypothetical protein VFJ08_00410 [Salinisphaera sp.]|nr:hypothetical protein [Salinisphaera sp.]HET7312798.1 hypothetical protein [Salinisphaera sp.]